MWKGMASYTRAFRAMDGDLNMSEGTVRYSPCCSARPNSPQLCTVKSRMHTLQLRAVSTDSLTFDTSIWWSMTTSVSQLRGSQYGGLRICCVLIGFFISTARLTRTCGVMARPYRS